MKHDVKCAKTVDCAVGEIDDDYDDDDDNDDDDDQVGDDNHDNHLGSCTSKERRGPNSISLAEPFMASSSIA